MKLILTEIHKKLNKAYLKQDLNREQVETFKSNLKILFSKSEIAEKKKEHEEHFKNIVSDFLKDTYYKKDYEININKRKDLVIHNGKSSSDSVGVIIEAKKPSNEAEMISQKTPNAKALHELLHYYMQERFINDNKELKHIIATNSYDWYIFDAADFERFFYENKKIRKSYEDWNNGVLVGSNTDWFYNEVAKPYIDKELTELEVVHFNLLDYKEITENSKIEDDDNLINLYKILSPEHLLKKPFANDSNALNKEFYNELLHIIGLEEKPDGGKKLIDRKGKNREDGSLLENTINILIIRNKLKSFDNPEQFGETEEDQLYSVGLELCITWLNRILFLKLLEGQLIKYHNGNLTYSFIDAKKINDFDEIDELFFEVLAVKTIDRSKSVNEKFGNIPYLNSSLFEISELESNTIQLSDLKGRLELSLYSHSVLKNKDENKQVEKKNTLHYLFEFLSAYNFSSDSSAKIQEDNKTIINASVLGLIFEKINGYKDGSFFTPGFITMYMCSETIRRAVAQKFKELENSDIESFKDVKNYCTRYFKKDDLFRFNSHIDSLKICDPAVGSGHFLVSALNEIIAIKSELNILVDTDGTPLEYEITVDNDELTVLSKKTNKPFEYLLGADDKPPKSLQQVQVTLFEEKQKIIENCLFGVDINPKSVLICRLRLWIELLKNAYYKPDSFTELETLPNIDINIKCGNSLISRFNITDEHSSLPPSTQQKIKLATEKYKQQVIIYKSTSDKTTKQNAEKEIYRLKEQFAQIANPNDNDYKRLKEKKAQLGIMPLLFSREEQEAWKQKTEALTKDVEEIENIYNEKLKNLYLNALEWRFEFPEVLNKKGDFLGFDVVIANPPYIQHRELAYISNFLKENYKVYSGTSDISSYFFEKFIQVLKLNGIICVISSNKFFKTEYGKKLRLFLSEFNFLSIINFEQVPIFEEALVSSAIILFKKELPSEAFTYTKFFKDRVSSLKEINQRKTLISQKKLKESAWLFNDSSSSELLGKIKSKGIPIGEIPDIEIKRGITTGYDNAFLIDKTNFNIIYEKEKNSERIIKKVLKGEHISRYAINFKDLWIINSHNGIKGYSEPINVEKDYPSIYAHFQSVNIKSKGKVENRSDKGKHWTNLRSCAFINDFEKPKIVWGLISGNWEFAYDDVGYFLTSASFFLISKRINQKFLLGLLNSKLFQYFFIQVGEYTAGGAFVLKKTSIEKFVIPQIDETEQKLLIDLVELILSAKKQKQVTSELEKQIDQLVYKLYNLTPEEIEIIEKS